MFAVFVTRHISVFQGAGCCRFESDRALPENVLTGFASFENLETVEVHRLMDKFLIGMKIPSKLILTP